MRFYGMPYPITQHPRGFLRTQRSPELLKSDLMTLLLTNPGERVMLPTFGTPLISLLFEPNDDIAATQARQMIIDAIQTWEPRIVVQNLTVSRTNLDLPNESPMENNEGLILLISLEFSEFDNIQSVQALNLEVPLSNGV